jgi:hypothetical protein
MSNNIIYVSGFMSNVNNNKKLDDYITYGKKLIDLNNSSVIFIEKHIFIEYFKEYLTDTILLFKYDNKNYEYIIYNNIIFVFYSKSDIYLYDYYNEITNYNIITDNTNKDTIEYMFTICNKTEWVKIAIYLYKCHNNIEVLTSFEKTYEFIWIDFGIYHVIKDDILFENEINNMKYRTKNTSDKVRIASCWNVNYKYNTDIYRNISWYFAGGIFGGNPNKLIEFANLMKNKCIEIIKDKKNIMWEVNIWYLIYKDNPFLFDSYICNHDLSIINKY